jgi:hypothetical protein
MPKNITVSINREAGCGFGFFIYQCFKDVLLFSDRYSGSLFRIAIPDRFFGSLFRIAFSDLKSENI